MFEDIGTCVAWLCLVCVEWILLGVCVRRPLLGSGSVERNNLWMSGW